MVDKNKAKEWLETADGYSIMDTAFFQEMGLTIPSRVHSSDPRFGKNAAHRSDGRAGDVEGVSEFLAIHYLARELGVPLPAPYFGRGSNFAIQAETLRKALEESL